MNKQSSNKFNELIQYIEEHLCDKINYKKLSQILGVNEYTMHRIFLFVTNYTLADYIRKRRLSMSALDLLENNFRIIDIAMKYNYESSQAFSRAFKNMMGFLPSEINKNQNNIIFFSKYELETEEITNEFNYHIEKNIEFNLYGIWIGTTINNCHKDAPIFWKKYVSFLDGKSEFGLFEYDKKCITTSGKYYIASKEKFKNSEKINIKSSNYLVFECEYLNSKNLDEFCKKIYRVIIPDFGYEVNDLPDIEEYLPNKKLILYIPIK